MRILYFSCPFCYIISGDKMKHNIKVYTQNSISIDSIYFDPYQMREEKHDASFIFITHPHYDHFSLKDILKVSNKDSKIIIPKELASSVTTIFNEENILTVEVNSSYTFHGLSFSTVPAYNLDKEFHKKEFGWVGYLLNLDNTIYYIAGDTDLLEENLNIQCDVCFVPIGGTYTMNYKEAADFVNKIHPKLAIPTHYGSIVGKVEDGISFSKRLNSSIQCEIYIK